MREIRKYYDKHDVKEWKRLFRSPFNRLEFDTTMRYLRRYLPKKGSILDAGGGPGRYSIALAKMGYEVTLLDYSPKLLDVARHNIRKEGLESRVIVLEGNVANLSLFKTSSFDAVLCLGGVLSHVVKESERSKAVRELKRVAKRGSPLFISVIGRLGVMKKAPTFFPKEVANRYFRVVRDTGYYDGSTGFTKMHGFLLEDFKRLIVKNGLWPVKFVGLEGLSSSNKDNVNKLFKTPKLWKAWMETHAKTCEIPSVVDTSEHMLCVCKK